MLAQCIYRSQIDDFYAFTFYEWWFDRNMLVDLFKNAYIGVETGMATMVCKGFFRNMAKWIIVKLSMIVELADQEDLVL